MSRATIRPYQYEGIEAWARLQVAHPGASAIISLPTGCGKTILAILIAMQRKRTLFLARRKELVEQPVKAWTKMGGAQKDAGIVAGGRCQYRAPRFLCATVQSLHSKRVRGKVLDHAMECEAPFDLIVYDEAHHAAADQDLEVLRAFRPEGSNIPLLGLTATPSRSDKQGLGGAGGPFSHGIIYRYPIRRAEAEGYLCPHVVRPAMPATQAAAEALRQKLGMLPKVDGSKSVERMLLEAEYAERIFVPEIEEVVKEGRKPVVFTTGVTLSKRVVEVLRLKGVSAAHIDGTMKNAEREEVLAAHQSGKVRVLCNVDVLTEGYDDPALDCVILATPTRSKERVIQMVGRGLRLHTGKKDLLVKDLVGRMTDLDTAKILTEYEPAEEEAEEVGKEAKEAVEKGGLFLQDRLAKLLEAIAGPQARVDTGGFVARWSQVREEAHTMVTTTGALLVLRQPGSKQWETWLRSGPANSRLTIVGDDLDDVRSRAQEWAVSRGFARYSQGERLNRSRPASAAQRSMLKRLAAKGIDLPVKPEDKDLKIGDASDIISTCLAREAAETLLAKLSSEPKVAAVAADPVPELADI